MSTRIYSIEIAKLLTYLFDLFQIISFFQKAEALSCSMCECLPGWEDYVNHWAENVSIYEKSSDGGI